MLSKIFYECKADRIPSIIQMERHVCMYVCMYPFSKINLIQAEKIIITQL